jgi:DNA-entry nuclease
VVIKSAGDNVEQVSIAVMSAIPRNLQTQKVVTEKVTEEPKTEKKTEKETDTYKAVETLPTVNSYVLNTSTHKFHKPSCGDVDKISSENYATFEGSRDDVIAQGYDPCGHCNP